MNKKDVNQIILKVLLIIYIFKIFIMYSISSMLSSILPNLKKDAEKAAEKAAETFKTNFDDKIQSTILSYNIYKSLLLNFNNIFELYTNLINENTSLDIQVKSKNSDVLTNNRKTYYEDQSIDNLDSIHTIILIIYAIFIIGFTVAIFRFPSESSRTSLLCILVFFIIYPFISVKIFRFLYDIKDIIMSVFPKDVYKNI